MIGSEGRSERRQRCVCESRCLWCCIRVIPILVDDVVVVVVIVTAPVDIVVVVVVDFVVISAVVLVVWVVVTVLVVMRVMNHRGGIPSTKISCRIFHHGSRHGSPW